jgi:Mn2+/Fe2+ NRAMP family transporter
LARDDLAATATSTLTVYFVVDPIKALLCGAIVHCLFSVPILVAMMLVGKVENLMGQFTMSACHSFYGWGATVVMAIAVLVPLSTSF